MKKTIFILLCLIKFNAFSQKNTTPTLLFKQAGEYLLGVNKPYNPEKARQLFWQLSSSGDARAMNALGNIYAKGIEVSTNIDSAISWYNKSATNGYSPSYYNLGALYKSGFGVQQNFLTAANYFKKGDDLNNIDCKRSLAYMYYKGFGLNQSYDRAFELYFELAKRGDINSMYFLGLCYRNGYGVSVNLELSKLWLQKAAKRQDEQALHELNEESLPENISTVSPSLQNELALLKNYNEDFIPLSTNNYEGEYVGYAIYYDWSGKFVNEIKSLKLNLVKNDNGYKGIWEEGETPKTPVSFGVVNNKFTFNEGSKYTRTNHYSKRLPEPWEFNNAQLDLGFVGDSIQLTGYVQFYSPVRKEPGKPLQIILKRVTKIDVEQPGSILNFTLFPNPATNNTNAQFTITKSGKVGFVITSSIGTTVYRLVEKSLPIGTYNYNLPLNNLSSQIYNVHIVLNGKIVGTKQLVKQ